MEQVLTLPKDKTNLYFSNIEQRTDTDMITLEELDHSHPRGVITLYNGFDPVSKKDYELSSFNIGSLVELVVHGKKFNPATREPFDENQLYRINWYNQGLQLFPNIKSENITNYKTIIANWLSNPVEENINTNMARYFITYEQLIDYYNFNEIDTREKAEEYLNLNSDKTWVIRKSSITDTKYNQFFVLMIKSPIGFNNYLYVHRQGYGITPADANRYADISTVSLNKSEYYTNIVDLLITKCKNKFINL